MLLFDERANGKILLTAEYFVLDGALALAFPTKFGQQLKVFQTNSNTITYTAYNANKEKWFQASLNTKLELINNIPTNEEKKLQQIFKAIQQIQPNAKLSNLHFESFLEFPNNYGLGSSSTIIALLAKFYNINPYKLLEKTFGGSGYDVACAFQNQAITYQLSQKYTPQISLTNFKPKFSNQLFFIHLNQKQNSQEAVANYKNTNIVYKENTIKELNNITHQIINTISINNFCNLLNKHEHIIANTTKQATIKSLLFNDYPNTIKSLGAWGGDFILAIGNKEEVLQYFKSKEFSTIISYNDMVLQ